MVLTRELIRDGWIQQLLRSSGDAIHVLSEEELRDSRDTMLSEHTAGRELAVFAYGSTRIRAS